MLCVWNECADHGEPTIVSLYWMCCVCLYRVHPFELCHRALIWAHNQCVRGMCWSVVQVHTTVKMLAHPRDRARKWTFFRLTAPICSYQVSLHHLLLWVWVTTLLAVWLYKLSQFLTLHNPTLKTEVLCLSQMPTRLHCEIPNFILQTPFND